MRFRPVVLARPGVPLLAAIFAVSACAPGSDRSAGSTAQEDRQLNEGAASLDANGADSETGDGEDS